MRQNVGTIYIQRYFVPYGLPRCQISLVVRGTLDLSRPLSDPRQMQSIQPYQSIPSKSLGSQATNVVDTRRKKVLIVEKGLNIMDDDPSSTFPNLELRMNYLNEIQGNLLPYTCKDDSKQCIVELTYWYHAQIWQTKHCQLFVTKKYGS